MPNALVLDLRTLQDLHPELDPETVVAIGRRAAAAFERSGHESPCGITLMDGSVSYDGTAVWAPADEGLLVTTDARSRVVAAVRLFLASAAPTAISPGGA